MVASIEETADRYHIPKPFIGLILIPIVVCVPLTQVFRSHRMLMIYDTGQCRRTCYIYLDGAEEQDGTDYHNLCRKFNRERNYELAVTHGN